MSVTMRWIDTWIKNPGSLYYSRKKQKGKKTIVQTTKTREICILITWQDAKAIQTNTTHYSLRRSMV